MLNIADFWVQRSVLRTTVYSAQYCGLLGTVLNMLSVVFVCCPVFVVRQYACRKTLADSRPRVRGRFARNDEIEDDVSTALQYSIVQCSTISHPTVHSSTVYCTVLHFGSICPDYYHVGGFFVRPVPHVCAAGAVLMVQY